MSKSRIRRVVQAVCLSAFLLFLAAVGLREPSPFTGKLFSFFLVVDPLSALTTSVSSRGLAGGLAPALLLVVLTLIFGRFFCGYICPMGTTVDIFDKLNGGQTNNHYPAWRPVRWVLLAAVVFASLLGLNLAFHFLPMSLATRFYGLVMFPAGTSVISETVGLAQNNLGWFGYFEAGARRYASILVVAAFFLTLFMVSRKSSRFWCRYVCPSGALLGLLSVFSLDKRKVDSKCLKCGQCEKDCPTRAIKEIYEYNPQDCITCRKCVDVCPVQAVSFSIGAANITAHPPVDLSRRELLKGTAVGGAAVLLSINELKSLVNINTAHGDIVDEGLLRPPGSRPEKEFLARCIRCGQCLVACPTNGLQPLLLQSGTAALYSPVLVPLRGPCEVDCNRCGLVCPTGAIAPLPLEEKQHAKIGTARIKKERCLAWEENLSCMVCHEMCPYNAMRLAPTPDHTVTVPRVDVNRCFGCGACEHSCPLEIPAVVVEPVKPLRLSGGSYRERSKELGLDLTASGEQAVFEADDSGGLPPGFIQ